MTHPGVYLGDYDGKHDNILFDHNLYFNNGWRAAKDGGLTKPGAMATTCRYKSQTSFHSTLAEIRTNTPWEDHGRSGDPLFAKYTLADHDMFDGSWPDLRITEKSAVPLNAGAELPASLVRLLKLFKVEDSRYGKSWDIGHHEWRPTPDGGAGDGAGAGDGQLPGDDPDEGGCGCVTARSTTRLPGVGVPLLLLAIALSRRSLRG